MPHSFGHTLCSRPGGLPINEDMSVAAHSFDLFISTLEDSYFISSTGVAKLVDSQAKINDAGKGDGAKKITMR